MSLRVVALIACGGCWAASPPAAEAPSAPRVPTVEVPAELARWGGFEETGRFWPNLVDRGHPRLTFAQISCAQAAHEASPVAAYVRGWCLLHAGDRAGLGELVDAANSEDPAIADAAADDIAFVVAAGESVDAMVSEVSRIDADPIALDRLAAYVGESGRFELALAILAISSRRSAAAPAVECERALTYVRLRSTSVSDPARLEHSMRAIYAFGIPVCTRRAAAFACERALAADARAGRVPSVDEVTRQCRDYIGEDVTRERVLLAAAALTWPAQHHRSAMWLDVASLVVEAVPGPDAVAGLGAALDNYARSARCVDLDRYRIDKLVKRAGRVIPVAARRALDELMQRCL